MTVAESQELEEMKLTVQGVEHELLLARRTREALDTRIDSMATTTALLAQVPEAQRTFRAVGRCFVMQQTGELAGQLQKEAAAAAEARTDLCAKEAHLERRLRSCEENVKSFLAD